MSGYYEQYLFDQQFAHPGWSGIVAAVEDAPHTLARKEERSPCYDFIVFELLLEIDALDHRLGKNWRPLCEKPKTKIRFRLFEKVAHSELHEVLILWQNAFEWSYYDEVLGGIALTDKMNHRPPPSLFQPSRLSFVLTKGNVRYEGILSNIDPECETLGSPGFFGAEFYFQQEGSSL